MKIGDKGWVIFNPNGTIIANSFHPTEQGCKEQFTTYVPGQWSGYEAKGFWCEHIEITWKTPQP